MNSTTAAQLARQEFDGTTHDTRHVDPDRTTRPGSIWRDHVGQLWQVREDGASSMLLTSDPAYLDGIREVVERDGVTAVVWLTAEGSAWFPHTWPPNSDGPDTVGPCRWFDRDGTYLVLAARWASSGQDVREDVAGYIAHTVEYLNRLGRPTTSMSSPVTAADFLVIAPAGSAVVR
jgi:hypothetical protein